jgi:hypothetical protein
MRFKAHIRPVLRILLCLRAFSDFFKNAGDDMKFENHPRVTTQATGSQAEAATAGGSQWIWRRSKNVRISAYTAALMGQAGWPAE